MEASSTVRIRRSLADVQRDYDAGQRDELEALWRAWKGIKELPATDPNSFFTIGGYHGEPFRGAGWGTSAYWGGYCNHGNVLFPTWHRAYLLRLEDALRSIPGCAEVTLPFWDETSDESATTGIPRALTDEHVTLDGDRIPNPLRSFVFNRAIVDHLSPFPDADYGKPVGYETVRYPLSGLVGKADRAATDAHNVQFPHHDQNVALLNTNVIAWLTSSITVNGTTIQTNVRKKYIDCLSAPNFTVFSNTTSAAEWNDHTDQPVMALESPHNSIHLAIGGYDVPGQTDFSPISGANGDMGENDTAGLDPIFFFHHAHVDRMFWLWQVRNGHTDSLEIIEGYPGTNSVDNQGPTPGVAPNSWLGLDSPLAPFCRSNGQPYISRDCINIETQLGYTYGPGSLADEDGRGEVTAAADGGTAETNTGAAPGRVISVRGVSRAGISGSFLVSAFATIDGVQHHVGTEAILSRWHVEGCMNCQTHLEARAHIAVPHPLAASVSEDVIDVQLHTRAQSGDPALSTESAGRPIRSVAFHLR